MNLQDAWKINSDYMKLESSMLQAIADGNEKHITLYLYPIEPVELINLIFLNINIGNEWDPKKVYIKPGQAKRLSDLSDRFRVIHRTDLYTDPINAFEIIGVFVDIIHAVRCWISLNDPQAPEDPDLVAQYAIEKESS